MADLTVKSTERLVGSGHPTLTDTLNRLVLVGHNVDGTHKSAGITYSDVYPIGCIYQSVVSTSPATLFGMGTWVALGAGKVLVGIDAADTDFDTVEETGGEKTHVLTIAEMPAHDHSNGGGTTSQFVNGVQNAANRSRTGFTGGGVAHNNLQPYIVVYRWKRTV